MKKFLFVLLLSLLFTSNLSANTKDKNFLIKFDGICVQNIDKIELVNSFAQSSNWMAIPPEKQALIAPRTKGPGFKAYGFMEEKIVYMIAINDAESTNTCAIASMYDSIENFKVILNEFYKLRLIETMKQGIQNMEFYNIDLIQSDKKGMLHLNYSEQEGYEFATITVMLPRN